MPPPSGPCCPECGGRQLAPDESGRLVCLCGLMQPDPLQPFDGVQRELRPTQGETLNAKREGAQVEYAQEGQVGGGGLRVVVEDSLSAGSPYGQSAEPEAGAATPTQRSAKQPAKTKPKSPATAKQKIPKWLPEVAKRLGGVPRFVVKDAKNCTTGQPRTQSARVAQSLVPCPLPRPPIAWCLPSFTQVHRTAIGRLTSSGSCHRSRAGVA